MSVRKKFFLVFCFIIFDALLLIGFLAIKDATEINKLKKEVDSLAKLDIMTDDFNTSIKTTGKYADVEKVVKEYLSGYSVGVQEVSKVVSDERLATILSYNNYASDGPNFDSSLEYLTTSKEEFNNKIDVLLDSIDNSNMKKFIRKRIKEDFYRNLCYKLLTRDSIKESLYPTKDLLMKTKVKMNNVYDISSEVLAFLKDNQAYWYLDNNEIKFKNREDLFNQYDELISKIK